MSHDAQTIIGIRAMQDLARTDNEGAPPTPRIITQHRHTDGTTEGVWAVVVFIAIAAACLSIASLVVAVFYMKGETCATLNNIMPYRTWLWIYSISLLPVPLCVYYIGTKRMGSGSFMVWVYMAFHFAWYVLGTIVYFQSVEASCDENQMLHQLGLAIIVVESTFYIFALCVLRRETSPV